MRSLCRLSLILILTVAVASPAVGQTTYTWSGGGANANWSTAGNWGGTAPLSDILNTRLVKDLSTDGNSTVDTNLSANSLTFAPTALAYVVGNSNGAVLTLGSGGVTNNSPFNNQTFNAAIAVGAAQSWTNNGTGLLTIGGPVNGGAFAVTVAGTGNTTLGGVLAGTGRVVKNGAATLALNGASTFTGGVTLNAGTLSLGNNAGLGTGTLTVGAVNTTISVTGTAATFANNIALVNAAGRVNFSTPASSNTTLSGTITGGAASTDMTVASGTEWFLNGGSGVNSNAVTITGDNTGWQGTLTVSRGPLILGSATAAGSTVIRVDSNLPAAGALQLAGNFTAANNVYLVSASAQTVGVGSGLSAGLSGIIAGNGTVGLAKVGTGTLTLSGANTYAGPTTVSAGQLLVSNTGGSGTGTGAVTVSNGATLGGLGTIGGATTVNAGGTIRGDSGTGTGTLTARNVTVNTGATLAATVGAPGVASQLNVGANTLNLQTNAVLKLTAISGFSNTEPGAVSYTLATLSSGSNLQLDGVGGLAEGTVFGTYVQGTGASGPVVIDASGLGFSLAGEDTFSLKLSGNNLVLVFTPVPEPATVLAIGAAGLGLIGMVRRRRKVAVTA